MSLWKHSFVLFIGLRPTSVFDPHSTTIISFTTDRLYFEELLKKMVPARHVCPEKSTTIPYIHFDVIYTTSAWNTRRTSGDSFSL